MRADHAIALQENVRQRSFANEHTQQQIMSHKTNPRLKSEVQEADVRFFLW